MKVLIVLVGMICALPAQADKMKIKSGTLNYEIVGESTLTKRAKRVIAELKKAAGAKNRAIKKFIKDLEDLTEKVQNHLGNDRSVEYAQALATLSAQLTNLEDTVSKLMNIQGPLNYQIINSLANARAFIMAIIEKIEELQTKTWGVALSVSNSFNYSFDHNYALGATTASISAYWAKNNLALWTSLGLGVNLADPSVTWSAAISVEYSFAKDWAIGPVVTVMQDMGEWKYAKRITWSGGGKLRFKVNNFHIWMIPIAIGPYGQRLDREANPSFSFALTSTLGADYLIL